MKVSRLIALVLAAACIFTFTACGKETGEGAAEDYPVSAAGTVIDRKPQVVVSLAPAITDTLAELQLLGRLAAISDYCTRPCETADLEYYEYPRVGTQQLPDMEAIKALGADTVLTTTTLTENQLLELQQANIDVVVLEPAEDMDGIRQNYTDLFKVLYGEVTGGRMAEEYLANFDRRYEDIQRRVEEAVAARERPISAVYLAGDLLELATGDSFEGYILEEMGLTNWGADYTGYSYPKEKEVELNPDVVFYGDQISRDYIASSSCYKTTDAGTAGAIYYLDPEDFERQSPDLLDRMWAMGRILYPDYFVQEQPGDWSDIYGTEPVDNSYIPGEEEPAAAEPDAADTDTGSSGDSSAAE